MILMQIFFLIIFIFAFCKVLVRYIHREIRFLDTLLWGAIWIGGGIIMLIPNSTFYVARFFGVQRGADIVIYITLVVLLFIIFRLTITLERYNKEITLLTRHKTLKHIEGMSEEHKKRVL